MEGVNVTISRFAEKVQDITNELEIVENMQLSVADQMNNLLEKQQELANQSLELNEQLKTLVRREYDKYH